MRRKSRTKAEQPEAPRPDAEASAKDHDDFWSGAPAGVDERLATVAGLDEDDGEEVADDTLEYMGSVPHTGIDPDELVMLAEWAESKACRVCRKKMQETHDPATLKHADCRAALRVERLLRRYD